MTYEEAIDAATERVHKLALAYADRCRSPLTIRPFEPPATVHDLFADLVAAAVEVANLTKPAAELTDDLPEPVDRLTAATEALVELLRPIADLAARTAAPPGGAEPADVARHPSAFTGPDGRPIVPDGRPRPFYTGPRCGQCDGTGRRWEGGGPGGDTVLCDACDGWGRLPVFHGTPLLNLVTSPEPDRG